MSVHLVLFEQQAEDGAQRATILGRSKKVNNGGNLDERVTFKSHCGWKIPPY